MIETPTRAELLRAFDCLPDNALVDEVMAAAVRGKRPASLQRERWVGTGPEFIKDGARVGYRKCVLIAYLDKRAVAPRAA